MSEEQNNELPKEAMRQFETMVEEMTDVLNMHMANFRDNEYPTSIALSTILAAVMATAYSTAKHMNMSDGAMHAALQGAITFANGNESEGTPEKHRYRMLLETLEAVADELSSEFGEDGSSGDKTVH